MGVLLVTSCSPETDVEKNIRQMMSTTVTIQLDKMQCWNPDSIKKHNCEYKFVVYADTTQCSPCFINNLNSWNELIDLAENDSCDMEVIFILDPKDSESEEIHEQLDNSAFNYSVYIDTKHLFAKHNKQIPTESIYHNFLLDKENTIVLVGNPCNNPRIKELLLKQIRKSK